MFTYKDFLRNPGLLDNYSYSDKVPLRCMICDKHYDSNIYRIKSSIGLNPNATNICSMKCRKRLLSRSKLIKCTQCGNAFTKRRSQMTRSKSGNHFCSSSCAATYNNRNKSYGTRRSKLEIFIEKELTKLYPNEEVVFNSKEAIQSELDIFFPRLNLAFELNGIFHYEPIFGKDKLNQVQDNDHNKFQACQANGISLCIIDTSSQKYFREQTSRQYLDIIVSIIERHI